jgi:hypothetical protein
LAVILGIVGLQILDDSGGGSSDATVTTVAGVTTAPGASTTTAPKVRPTNEVRVKVYNASGVQGRAQTLTDTLAAKGYSMQTPANLAKQRQGTVVECVKGFENEGKVLGAFNVPGGAPLVDYPSDPPEGASDADCLVIIGA